MGIVVGAGNTVHGEEGLVHFLLQCQGFFQSMNVVVPVYRGSLDVLEDDATTALVLVFQEHLCVLSLLI